MIQAKSIILIEWADKFRDELSKLIGDQVNQIKFLWIKIEYGDDDEERVINVSSIL